MLRELLFAAEARRREDWAQTSELEAMMYNMWRGKGARAVSPAELNPTLSEAERRSVSSGLRITAGNIGLLKSVLPKSKRRPAK